MALTGYREHPYAVKFSYALHDPSLPLAILVHKAYWVPSLGLKDVARYAQRRFVCQAWGLRRCKGNNSLAWLCWLG